MSLSFVENKIYDFSPALFKGGELRLILMTLIVQNIFFVLYFTFDSREMEIQIKDNMLFLKSGRVRVAYKMFINGENEENKILLSVCF